MAWQSLLPNLQFQPINNSKLYKNIKINIEILLKKPSNVTKCTSEPDLKPGVCRTFLLGLNILTRCCSLSSSSSAHDKLLISIQLHTRHCSPRLRPLVSRLRPRGPRPRHFSIAYTVHECAECISRLQRNWPVHSLVLLTSLLFCSATLSGVFLFSGR